MGWTYAFERPADPKAELDGLLTWSDARGRRRVLDSAIVRLRVYYAAVEHIAPDGARQVWAAVFLVDFRRGADSLAALGISVSDDTVYRALRELGFSHVSARPKAYKQDPDAMEAFKKTFPPAWRRSALSLRLAYR